MLGRLAEVGELAFNEPDLRLIADAIARPTVGTNPSGRLSYRTRLPTSPAASRNSATTPADPRPRSLTQSRCGNVTSCVAPPVSGPTFSTPSTPRRTNSTASCHGSAALDDVAARPRAVPPGGRHSPGRCGDHAHGDPAAHELVDGLLTECGKFMIGGGSKSFKTWLLLDLALALSTGSPFLNRPRSPPRSIREP